MALRKVTGSQGKRHVEAGSEPHSRNVLSLVPDPAPLFIFGCGRSGTSLLSRMLNQHPEIAVPYESHLFNTFYGWLPLYGDLAAKKNLIRLIEDVLTTDVMQDWDPQLSLEEVCVQLDRQDFAGVFTAILSAYARKTGKTRWGEKTPQHIFFWDQISRSFPDARVIHIVRDGRDVALSLLRARFGPKSVFGCARYWKRYLREVARLKTLISPENIHEIQYEALLTDPERELTAVCRFMGEEFTEEMLAFHKNRSRYKTDLQNQQNLMGPLLTENRQKWRREMSRKDLQVFESVAGALLEEYGYERAISDPVSLNPLLSCYCRYIETPILKLIAMLKNRKGHRDGLIRLGIYLRLQCIDRFFRR